MPRAKQVLVLGLSVGATLLVVEALARLCSGPPEYLEGHPFDPELGFAEVPGSGTWTCDERGKYRWVLNSRGFRGPELPAAGTPAGAGPRILFVGDSFLYGWGVRSEE